MGHVGNMEDRLRGGWEVELLNNKSKSDTYIYARKKIIFFYNIVKNSYYVRAHTWINVFAISIYKIIDILYVLVLPFRVSI